LSDVAQLNSGRFQYCKNECILRAHFANIVAYAYTSCCTVSHVVYLLWMCVRCVRLPLVSLILQSRVTKPALNFFTV
jgi:hypothetical protein